jgi:hypothetical protein
VTVFAWNLEVGGHPLQLRMPDENLELVAELSFADVGVTVAVRSERRGGVVDMYGS